MIARPLIASLALLAGMTAVAQAQYYPTERPYRERPYRPEPAQRYLGCTAHEHANFGGARLPLGPGEYPFVGEGWNDRISAISCTPGCRIVAYEHANFGGARQVFAGSVGFVGQFWNDRISSAQVSCRR